ncbi:hypothetical protein OVY01_08605 [Robbsia sp. Bb-Pol-6]|uniref:Transposase n=1 Tax=Robbsia betulipollinis TaxID=2981849 RepID=A0ABT3ZL78_9BURK|nr:hypothetical protein [Robbsia betulipollinis]MCY0387293.1 hypothetical protein [Robbsia betulipollinis]
MTICTDARGARRIHLDDFRRYAGRGPAIAVVEHPSAMKLIAVGMTPAGCPVAWLEPGIDTVRHFVAALRDAFGAELVAHTVRELGLTPRPGEALSSALVQRAVTMTETARVALDGVDFLAGLLGGAHPAIGGTTQRLQ